MAGQLLVDVLGDSEFLDADVPSSGARPARGLRPRARSLPRFSAVL